VSEQHASAPDASASTIFDASGLPSYAFGHRGLMWWGTLGMIALEGTAFALAIAAYLYLWSQATVWPLGAPPPELLFGTVNVLILLVSMIPNEWARRASERHDLRAIRIALILCVLVGAALLVIRAFEFSALNVSWDTSAYGSVVWLLLGLHTAHLLTDFYDTVVLAVLMFTDRIEGKRYVDVSENAMYWYFVVASWLPIYGIIYWMPRLG
jgi:cytochrome c oxidase subunit III